MRKLTAEEEEQMWEHYMKLEEEYHEQKEWMIYLEEHGTVEECIE
jgi:hypothetical protein